MPGGDTILLTGATGFVGRHVLARLLDRGLPVVATASPGRAPERQDGVDWRPVDLTDPKAASGLMAEVRPARWLHLAWIATPGKFWSAPENLHWLSAGAAMAAAFYAAGGRYALGVGTCAEYGGDRAACREGETPVEADTVYGRAKVAMGAGLLAAAQAHGGRAGWARVFFPYGPGEPAGRLIPSVIQAVLKGEVVETTHGRQVRDFIYVADVAEALVRLLDAEAEGPVNVGSGVDTSLRQVIETITDIAGGADLVRFGARAAPAHEPPALVASVDRLRAATGWQPQTGLRDGLERCIADWKTRLDPPSAAATP